MPDLQTNIRQKARDTQNNEYGEGQSSSDNGVALYNTIYHSETAHPMAYEAFRNRRSGESGAARHLRCSRRKDLLGAGQRQHWVVCALHTYWYGIAASGR
ncbi:hypothetical protein NDU88_010478 [Pleurodeles waltl]|uniref:Uncharacterized protein n=1 Tax=Pleurodeles waltl TaxID=8319 RepID=A0AAV7RZR8_PLEWA|nr:hypothetical protein NDU88_010478 [Pleurodeles waltl]